MPTEWNRDPVKDFLFVRPFFTPRRLRLTWLFYLIIWVPLIIGEIAVTLSTLRQMPSLDAMSIIYLTEDILLKVVYLILVRLLLEAALLLLSRSPQEK
jgi:hypothetical protein